MFGRFSNTQLLKFAAFTAVGVTTTGLFLQSRMRQRVTETDFYREAMRHIRLTPAIVDLLGEPIKDSPSSSNAITDNLLEFKVRLKGPRQNAYLFLETERFQNGTESEISNKTWKLTRMELELDSDKEKRLRIL